MLSISKTVALGLTASALIFTACGQSTEEGAAPAGVTIPDAPDAAIQTVITEFAQGNGGIIWQAMPSTYQTDVNDLLHLAGSKLDAEIYDKSFATIARLADVVEQQQAFILGSSFMEGRSVEEMAQLEAALPSVVGIVNTLTTSELASTAGLANFDGQAFLIQRYRSLLSILRRSLSWRVKSPCFRIMQMQWSRSSKQMIYRRLC